MEDHTTVDSTLAIHAELRSATRGPAPSSSRTSSAPRTTAGRWPRPAPGSGWSRAPTRSPPSVAYQDKAEVDKAYVRCLRILIDGDGLPDGRLARPAHDRHRPGAGAARHGRKPGEYEFQMLYGIRTAEQRRLAAEGDRMRVYVPYGADWYGYFMRRLAERPANLAFFLRSFAPAADPPDTRTPTPDQGETLHGRCDPGPRAGQRAGAQLRARHPRARPAGSQAQGAGRQPPSTCR